MRAITRRYCPWMVFGVATALTFSATLAQAQELTVADASVTESDAGNVIATLVDALGIGTILDNEPTPLPAFATASTSIAEGAAGRNPVALVTVDLSGVSEVPLSYKFATADVAAVAASDYVSGSGTLAFAPGESQKNITVSLIGDNAVEDDESLALNLLIPRGGVTHSLNIINDDTAGVVANAVPTPSELGLLLLLTLIGCVSAESLLRRHRPGVAHYPLLTATDTALSASLIQHAEPSTSA